MKSCSIEWKKIKSFGLGVLQTNRWISSSGDYILLSANVSPTNSSGLLQGNVFNHKTCSIPKQWVVWRTKTKKKRKASRYKNGDSMSQKIRGSIKWKNVGKWWSAITQQNRPKPIFFTNFFWGGYKFCSRYARMLIKGSEDSDHDLVSIKNLQPKN